MAVSIKAVDEALATRYSGLSIDVGEPPLSVPVEVFIEEPLTEQQRERAYPSISLKLIAISFDSARSHSDDDAEEEVGYNDLITPPERSMRLSPAPFRLTYSLDTWHKVRAGESRDLVTYALIERTHPRGSLSVEDVGGGSELCWVLWTSGVASNDELMEDLVIYHKTVTVDVLVYLLTDPSVRSVKVAIESLWKTYGRRTVVDADGIGVLAVPNQDVPFNVMHITQSEIYGGDT